MNIIYLFFALPSRSLMIAPTFSFRPHNACELATTIHWKRRDRALVCLDNYLGLKSKPHLRVYAPFQHQMVPLKVIRCSSMTVMRCIDTLSHRSKNDSCQLTGSSPWYRVTMKPKACSLDNHSLGSVYSRIYRIFLSAQLICLGSKFVVLRA